MKSANTDIQPKNTSNAFIETFGFHERDYVSTKEKLRALYNPSTKTFNVNGRIFRAGTLLNPKLDQQRESLRQLSQSYHQVAKSSSPEITISADNQIGQVDHIQVNSKGVYQAASQFNGLEFIQPTTLPENGIQSYIYDRTQGPAIALAALCGTAVRNYLAVVNDDQVLDDRDLYDQVASSSLGQSANRQINCLADIMKLLKQKCIQTGINVPLDNINSPNPYGFSIKEGDLFAVKNGYVESTDNNLFILNELIEHGGEEFKEQIKNALRCCIQRDTEVTSDPRSNSSNPNLITQVYVSALSFGYSKVSNKELWAPFAKIILEAAYEHTILEGLRNNLDRIQKGLEPQPIYLTMLGGGVFGNNPEWIKEAISSAIIKASEYQIPFAVKLVHYLSTDTNYPQSFLDQAVAQAKVKSAEAKITSANKETDLLSKGVAGVRISQPILADEKEMDIERMQLEITQNIDLIRDFLVKNKISDFTDLSYSFEGGEINYVVSFNDKDKASQFSNYLLTSAILSKEGTQKKVHSNPRSSNFYIFLTKENIEKIKEKKNYECFYQTMDISRFDYQNIFHCIDNGKINYVVEFNDIQKARLYSNYMASEFGVLEGSGQPKFPIKTSNDKYQIILLEENFDLIRSVQNHRNYPRAGDGGLRPDTSVYDPRSATVVKEALKR